MDHEEPCETCELCGQEGLRYHFEIQNDLTGHALEVGSHCILQFDVAVFEGGRRLTVGEAKKKLAKLTEQMRLASCVKALEKLARSERNDILESALSYYRKNKKLTPKLAFVVFWRLQKHGIDHSPSFFNVTLKKKRYVQDLGEMETSRVRQAVELGHTPPRT